ncbi:MAG: RIP metalloprotease RseP, partial [Deltaproteobacteria bacterium]
GAVLIDSSAWQSGFRAGDKILALNGESVSTWQELEAWTRSKEGQTAQVTVQRDQAEINLTVPLLKVQMKNPYGEEETVGGIKGISATPIASVVGISNPEALSYRAGLRTGDFITKVGNKEVGSFEDLRRELNGQWEALKPIELVYQSLTEGKKKPEEKKVSLIYPATKETDLDTYFGWAPAETFVRQVSKDSPAEKGGLLAGDRIIKIGDNSVLHFDSIVESVQDYGAKGNSVSVTVDRQGKPVVLDLKPIETTQEDPLTHQKFKKYMIGFAPFLVFEEPEYTSVQVREIPSLLVKAVGETNELARKMVVSLVKLATGGVSIKNLGGPLLIATVAGRSLDAGLVQFLQTMALISINLFLLNLFPIPILDGGHLLFFTLEAIKGKPVTIRTMEIANQIGMVFILTLVVLTLFNDISRIILH